MTTPMLPQEYMTEVMIEVRKGDLIAGRRCVNVFCHAQSLCLTYRTWPQPIATRLSVRSLLHLYTFSEAHTISILWMGRG